MASGFVPTAADYFGAMRESYDSLISRAVPGYAAITDSLVAELPAHAEFVVELGCGTGNLSLRLAARYASARFLFIDASEEMVGLTRARLAAAAPSLDSRFVAARFEDVDVGAEIHDLATSSFSLHHVEDKGLLFARVRRSLRPGGRFCFADQLRGATEESHARAWERWLAFCRQPGHCSEEEIEGLVAHSVAHDRYASVEEHFTLLRDAGFAAPDCVWREGMWGIISAVAS